MHFKSDLIHNMDNMRIAGTETYSVILNQRQKFIQLKRDVQKVPKKLKQEGMMQ